jgi:hypothetical protein
MSLEELPARAADENDAMTSPWPSALTPSVNEPEAVGWAAMKSRKAVPSARCTVGRKWLSDSVSASAGCRGSSRPHRRRGRWTPFWMRPVSPPRWHATILPVTEPAGSSVLQWAS